MVVTASVTAGSRHSKMSSKLVLPLNHTHRDGQDGKFYARVLYHNFFFNLEEKKKQLCTIQRSLGRTFRWLLHLECNPFTLFKSLLQCQILRQTPPMGQSKAVTLIGHSFSPSKALATSRNHPFNIYAYLLGRLLLSARMPTNSVRMGTLSCS